MKSTSVARCLLVTTTWVASCRTDDVDQIASFVQTVLALADRDELGLPESPVVRYQRPVVDGQLADDLRRFLEQLVGVSRSITLHDLVATLWDDAVAIGEDQDPHEVFERVRPFRNDLDENPRTAQDAAAPDARSSTAVLL